MGLSRRNVLLGLGTLIAGGGAVLGTGAFTTVEAERTVNIETAGDADAFLGIQPADTPNGDQYASETEGTVQIDIGGDSDGLNQDAITNIRDILTVTNNGEGDVAELKLQFETTPSGVDPDVTFDFLVGSSESIDHDSSANNGDGVDILTGNNNVPDTLGSGQSVNFGLGIDLLQGGDNGSLPADGSYNLRIVAES